MPSKLKDEDISVDDAPTAIDPYTVLSLNPDATPDQIKSAYRKAALKHHPDKAPPSGKEAAHTKFHEIAFAYAILSDSKRRHRYDSTGNTSESVDVEDDDFDWTSFFREQFRNVVTEDSIENFAQEYKGSEEEKRHVLAAYEKHKGDMNRLYQDVMLSDVLEDDERFREVIDRAIEAEDVEPYKRYTEESTKSRNARITTARKRKAKEAKEAEQALEDSTTHRAKKGTKEDDMAGLAALIQQRQKSRAGNSFENLEAKYATPSSGKASKKRVAADVDEPSEEAFARNRKAGKVGAGGEGDAMEGARRRKRGRKA